MTNESLSKKVAELYGIPFEDFEASPYLHEDSTRCFDLAVEHSLVLSWYGVCVGVARTTVDTPCYAMYEEHDNDKALAARVAILKCLLKMKE